MAGGPVRGDSISVLLDLIKSEPNTNRVGAGTSDKLKVAIIDVMKKIEENNAGYMASTKAASLVDGEWELLWTTEKETLFFVQRGLFGKQVTRISQTVDLRQKRLNNLIEFEGGRSFSVLGDISVPENNIKRVNFEFKSASLKIPPLPTLTLPPVGKGWFENIYVNNMYRLSRDVRGDYLVCKRAK